MPGYSRQLAEAFALALDLHQDQCRKGSDVPYVTHLMAVASIVGEYAGTEAQVIAALLHDAVEDQGGPKTLERIRATFGDAVAEYVSACSDTDAHPKPPWRDRKADFLAQLAHAKPEVKLIVAADKLHNARCMTNDLHLLGNGVWKRFTGGRDGTLWYMGEAVRALASGWSHPILRELADAVDLLHRCAYRIREDR